MINHLYVLLQKYPRAKWDWSLVSSNPNINEYIINKWRRLLNWAEVSRNEAITWRIVKDNLHLPWDWGHLSFNINITEEIMISHSYLPWVFNHVTCSNPILRCINMYKGFHEYYKTLYLYGNNPWEIYKLYPDIPWNFGQFPYLDFDIIFQTLPNYIWEDIFWNNDFDINVLEKHKEIIIILCEKHECLLTNASSDSKITIQYVLKNKNLPWDWYGLSLNTSISIEDIIQNSDLPWDWNEISAARKDLTIDTVIQNDQIHWCWKGLTYNFDRDVIDAYPNLPWEDEPLVGFEQFQNPILYNPIITPEPNVVYEDYHLSSSDIIKISSSKINFRMVSTNQFNKDPLYITQKYFNIFKELLHKRKQEKKHNMILYESVLDMFKLRVRDLNNGLRKSLI